MKKKLILMCIAGALVMTAVIGGTLAGELKDTQGIANIELDKFEIYVSGTGIGESTSGTISLETAAVPGGEPVEIKRYIKNSGDYDLYTRIVINKKWYDIDKSAESIQLVYNSELIGKWINPNKEIMSLDDEQVVLYYTEPVKSDGEIELPLEGISFPASLTNAYAGKNINIDIEVDAVQAAVVEDSMLSEWGVLPVFDENDKTTIIGIEE